VVVVVAVMRDNTRRQVPAGGRASGKDRDRDVFKGPRGSGEARALRCEFATGRDVSGSPRAPGNPTRRLADAPTRGRGLTGGRATRVGCTLAAHEEHRTWACDRRVGHAGLPGLGGHRTGRRSGDLRRDRSAGGVIVIAIASFRDRESAIRPDPVHGRVDRPPSSDRPRRRQRRQAMQDRRGLYPRARGLLWLHRGRCGPGRGQEARRRLRARPPQPLWRHHVRPDDVPAPELPAARRLRGGGLPPRGSASAAGEAARRPSACTARSALEIVRILGAERDLDSSSNWFKKLRLLVRLRET
jgi:hypothetical protein